MTHKSILGSVRQVFKSIEGRRMDMIYDTSGSHVSSFVITNNMWKYREVKQYQFIQTSKKNYIFKLNTDLPFIRANELTEEFKGYFGEDANITIDYVHEIPLLDSGKRKKVVNTCVN
jgi:phenylacetate-CoA ligase